MMEIRRCGERWWGGLLGDGGDCDEWGWVDSGVDDLAVLSGGEEAMGCKDAKRDRGFCMFEGLEGIHNLFGGPSVICVSQSDGPQSFAVTQAVSGPSCTDVLRKMQHEPQMMFEKLKHHAEDDVNGYYCSDVNNYGIVVNLDAPEGPASIPLGTMQNPQGSGFSNSHLLQPHQRSLNVNGVLQQNHLQSPHNSQALQQQMI
ncbi:hypothetical protein AgCh_033084 [Apium graveolens]